MKCGGSCCPFNMSCCDPSQQYCCDSCAERNLCSSGDTVLDSAAVDDLNRTFAIIDANHDGKLTLREGLDLFRRQNLSDEAFAIQDFLASDGDRNGFVDLKELLEAARP
ncbi:hypothetical protein AAVH_41785 [Aphelenchoides avenae]|nr:hypothetical protein AAVH_41785 [Aphelenchus avenae]